MVWSIADTMNGLMAIPNLIALVVLAPVVVRLIRDFEGKFSHAQNAVEPHKIPVRGDTIPDRS
jgi:AGCS family alanine or glycine:cation symporter